MEELLFLGGLAVEILFKQSDTWYDFVRNFMVSIVVLANSFYCVVISSYNGLYQPMYLRLIYWTLVLEGLKTLLDFKCLIIFQISNAYHYPGNLYTIDRQNETL